MTPQPASLAIFTASMDSVTVPIWFTCPRQTSNTQRQDQPRRFVNQAGSRRQLSQDGEAEAEFRRRRTKAYLQQQRVARLLRNRLGDAHRVRHQQVVADHLARDADIRRHRAVRRPVVLGGTQTRGRQTTALPHVPRNCKQSHRHSQPHTQVPTQPTQPTHAKYTPSKKHRRTHHASNTHRHTQTHTPDARPRRNTSTDEHRLTRTQTAAHTHLVKRVLDGHDGVLRQEVLVQVRQRRASQLLRAVVASGLEVQVVRLVTINTHTTGTPRVRRASLRC